MPVRVEVDVERARLHHRGLAIDAADAGAVMGRDDAVLHGLDRFGRDVGHDVALAEIAGEGAQAHEVDLELVQARVGRDVHRRQDFGADDAVLDQAVTRLEVLHAGIDVGIEHGRVAGRTIEVAGDDQALAQRHHGRPVRTELDGAAGRHAIPAAALDDAAIGLDGAFGGIEGRLREHRRGRALYREARIGVVALCPLGLIAEFLRFGDAVERGERADEGERAPGGAKRKTSRMTVRCHSELQVPLQGRDRRPLSVPQASVHGWQDVVKKLRTGG